MNIYIEELINRGFSPEEAKSFVKNIASEAFDLGEGNVTYDEMYGYQSSETFDDLFENEIK
jgi:hypothetical protein